MVICIPTKEQTITSLRVDPELWKEAKMLAIKNDMTLADLVNEAVKEWIRKKQEKEKK